MYSPLSTPIRVLRLRVKEKHARWLSDLAREVNTVFNYCNELSAKVFERERHRPSVAIPCGDLVPEILSRARLAEKSQSPRCAGTHPRRIAKNLSRSEAPTNRSGAASNSFL